MTTTRRNFFKAASLPAIAHIAGGAQEGIAIQSGPFSADGSFESAKCPEWFRDAKFGIWAHWGPTSAIGEGDWYARNMYPQISVFEPMGRA